MPSNYNISAKAAVGLVVALLVVGLLVAFISPIFLDALNDDQVIEVNQTEGETIRLSGSYTATLDDADITNSDIDVTVTNTDTGNNASITNLSENSSQNVTVDGDTFNVTNEQVISDTEADVTYTFATGAGWSGGAQALYGILGLFFILAMMLFVVRWATQYS